ncbi:signal recognition particle-docking protein FtsY [Natrialba asiatica]|uniref:Signal recognition particle receptor FtsY n=1 Tax=Natrialba asiatica (strain ATCC 700177 / DSM 12278 / JCM 9576 / FERM P-10747 / NBRC 102637 / 172P1) TaxID=29540 RepID=M0AKF5_NATA1|nr:signal recognition particle-docking protein FtsY [Natrialba asiatica]ELY97873.1 cell division protein FtsY [Natrialba asiatica DSM 12278]
MFDNLKEKLGSFRKDAEEAAEENVEEVDDTAVEAEAEVEAEGEGEGNEGGEIDPDAAESTVEEAPPTRDAAAQTTDEPATPDDAAAAASSSPSEPSDGGEEAVTDSRSEPAPATDATPDSPLGSGSASRPDNETATPADTTDADAELEEDAASAVDETEDEGEGEDEDEDEAAAETEADDATGTGFGRKAKSFVKGKFVIEEEDLEDPLYELEMALLSSDVEMGVAEEILDNIRDELVGETRTFTTSTGDVVENALREAIHDVISVGQFDFDEHIAVEDKPVTIVFTGVNGVGKTTSIAKLSRYFEDRGYSTVMANGDTYRAGANEQIQEHADALDTKLIAHEQGGDPAAVLYDAVEYAEANDIDVVLGDTAGRLHTNEGLMDQLEKIDRVVDPDMTLFVDEAVAGQDAVNRAREFNDAAEVDGSILTKADADSNGGAAISIAHVSGKPILFLGVGQGYDDIEQFDPDEMVDRLLEEDA